MPSTMTSRIDGLTTSVAVKPPIKIMASAPITLSGEQTINATMPDGSGLSLAVVEGDRVGVNGQVDQTQNGIYIVHTTAWTRARDFDGALDAVKGTLVIDTVPIIWRLITPMPVLFGTSNIKFETEEGFNQGNLNDLANTTDSRKGSAMVGRVYRQVDTIAELKTLSKLGSPYAEVLEYYSGAGVINSRYHLDLTDVISAGNDFTIVVAADGGRWKLKHADAYTLKMAGGREAVGFDDADAWDRLLAVSSGKKVEWSGTSYVGRSIVIPVDNIRLHAATKAATIKAIDGSNFEYTLNAVGRSGLEYYGFTVDSNRAGREAFLTTRTISVNMISCTDCQLTEVKGINAIGGAGIPGVGISTAGGGVRVNTTNCTALNCGVVGKAADGFFCSSSYSVNTGNIAMDCLDTGHVLESCSYSGIVGCASIRCGVIGAITNATGVDKYGNYINGLTGEDWNAGVTGGVQIGVFGAGNLIGTNVDGLTMVGTASFLGPGINVRRIGAGRIDGLNIEATIRNGSSQGILVDSANLVSIKASIVNVTNSCIQFMGDCAFCTVSGSTLYGGSFGVAATGTSNVIVNGNYIQGPTSWGIFAFDTSVVTSLMNHIASPASSHYESKDAGATLNRLTLIGSQISFNGIVAGAPAAALSSKTTLINGSGATAGVIGISAS
ncbi:hypothetical protein [Pseudomonas chlororaphis]|uniref:hypothetical protein n=1 Tax=Pseudomonas chlororaphis TaxID=587753 RepID=UPI001B344AFF|nr:hypothetical protein [Pseudomonas chlororaphis]MBP5059143.1 hypothetical protein [Pseudomonas chlororaphis]MBP5142688.1 hypothetical protein [Pseudomonas chlororaphis]